MTSPMGCWADMDSDDDYSMANDDEDTNVTKSGVCDTDCDVLAFRSVRELGNAYEASLSNYREYRSIDTRHNILCRYINEHSNRQAVSNGYLGNNKYIVPLHIPSIIPGHTHSRIAVCYGDTTNVGINVSIASRLVRLRELTSLKGVKSVSKALCILQECMAVNDINPPGFAHQLEYSPHYSASDAPITLGYSRFVQQLGCLNPSLAHEGKVYTLPTGCPDTRYRVPSG